MCESNLNVTFACLNFPSFPQTFFFCSFFFPFLLLHSFPLVRFSDAAPLSLDFFFAVHQFFSQFFTNFFSLLLCMLLFAPFLFIHHLIFVSFLSVDPRTASLPFFLVSKILFFLLLFLLLYQYNVLSMSSLLPPRLYYLLYRPLASLLFLSSFLIWWCQ